MHFKLLKTLILRRGTPFKPSKYHDAGSYRLCTFALLQHLHSGRSLAVLNTHLDDRSDNQRRLGGSLLLHRAQYEAQVQKHPVLMLGDFNSPQSGRDSGAYRIVTGEIDSIPVASDFQSKYPIAEDSPPFQLRDLKAETPRRFVSGHYATFTGIRSWRS